MLVSCLLCSQPFLFFLSLHHIALTIFLFLLGDVVHLLPKATAKLWRWRERRRLTPPAVGKDHFVMGVNPNFSSTREYDKKHVS
jgi:hypothetical protein